MISNSRRTIAELADDVIRRCRNGSASSQGAGALKFLTDFEKHSDNPEAFEELVEALEDRGGSAVDLVQLPMSDISTVPIVVMRQHAVGHGGFHVGAMGRGSARLRWVYDCGSLRREGQKRLTEEIRRLAGEPRDGKRRIDLLFISHFDRDHVSGIVELMRAVEVETVVIPYLDDRQRAAVLVAELSEREEADAGADPRLTEALFDPVAWLTGLGASRVVQVRPGGPGFDGSRLLRFDAGGGPDLPEGVRGAQAVLVRQNDRVAQDANGHEVVDSGSGWMVTHFGRRFGEWCFLPYVTPARESALNAFEAAFVELLAPHAGETMVAAFGRKMAEDGFPAKVKVAYREHELGDANAVSMSLYVGPFRDAVWYARRSLRVGDAWRSLGLGWLLTGDAKLAQIGRRELWLAFYGQLKDRIGALMLPHHGSHLNFHEDILRAVGKDCLLFACRRERKLGDPLHENVWPIIEHRPHAIVSDERRTSLLQVSGASVLESAGSILSRLTDEWN